MQLDRRIIYLLIFLSVCIPLATNFHLPPAPLHSASEFYDYVDRLVRKEGEVAFIAMDFGPGTKAENEPQTEVVLEHLFRKRVPTVLTSLTPTSEPFLKLIPERVAKRLMMEFPKERWEYGVDWVNVGYRPGGELYLQTLGKSENISEFLGKDIFGTALSYLPNFASMKTLRQVIFMGEFTGLAGAADAYVRFFQRADYIPPLLHGCTAITIPDSYIYLDSGQFKGLLEGAAGAAWYSKLLSEKNPGREPDSSLVVNTALGIGQLAIVAFVILGNLTLLFGERRKK
jgi:hypothetical protein